jgi:hypothetical protein
MKSICSRRGSAAFANAFDKRRTPSAMRSRSSRPKLTLVSAIRRETAILSHRTTRSAGLAALQPAQLCRACNAALQAHFRQLHEGASAAAAENRGVVQRVCDEPNDRSRNAGVRENLKSSERRAALIKFFFVQQCQTALLLRLVEMAVWRWQFDPTLAGGRLGSGTIKGGSNSTII